MSTPPLIHHYTHYVRRRYHERVQKITVDAHLGCPNRDPQTLSGGCIYCNNASFAPTHLQGRSIREQIAHGIEVSKRRYKNVTRYIIYFQAYSNTYAPLDRLKALYEEALAHPQVCGLSIGTRPDCVEDEKLAYIATLARHADITLEYGLESFEDESLRRINRGHDVQTFIDAVYRTAAYQIPVCAHLILGLPWETTAHWIKASQQLSRLPIQFLKLHQLHIVHHTRLATEYLAHPFPLLSVDEYRTNVLTFLEHLNPNVVVQRLYGDAPKELLIAPDWGQKLATFTHDLENQMRQQGTYQGRLFTPPSGQIAPNSK